MNFGGGQLGWLDGGVTQWGDGCGLGVAAG